MNNDFPIENKVAKSGLITISMGDFYVKGQRSLLDISQFFWEGLVVKEKFYRNAIAEYDWLQYKNCNVAIVYEVDAIVPTWAYLLIVAQLSGLANTVVLGNLNDLEIKLFEQSINDFDFNSLKDKRVLVKGCSEIDVPDAAFVYFATHALPLVKSLMFGEACSNVPVFKR